VIRKTGTRLLTVWPVDIHNFLNDLPIAAKTPTIGYVIFKYICKYRVAISAVFLGLIILAGLGLYTQIRISQTRVQQKLQTQKESIEQQIHEKNTVVAEGMALSALQEYPGNPILQGLLQEAQGISKLT